MLKHYAECADTDCELRDGLGGERRERRETAREEREKEKEEKLQGVWRMIGKRGGGERKSGEGRHTRTQAHNLDPASPGAFGLSFGRT
eukprot:351815-Amorphochlora_amoeboformis.AAC.3